MNEPIETAIDLNSFDIEYCKSVDPIRAGMIPIKEMVSKELGVSIADMDAKTRKSEIVVARQMAMSLIKNHTAYTTKAIGNNFGGRDHSTVIHAIQQIKDLCQFEKRFKLQYDKLDSMIKL